MLLASMSFSGLFIVKISAKSEQKSQASCTKRLQIHHHIFIIMHKHKLVF